MLDLLVGRLDDKDDSVVAQWAYYLGLLRDPKAEPLVAAAPASGCATADSRASRPAPCPSSGSSGRSTAGACRRRWSGVWSTCRASTTPRAAARLAAGVGRGRGRHAGHRAQFLDLCLFPPEQPPETAGELLVRSAGAVKVWHNGRPAGAVEGQAAAETTVPLDLQPGSNDILIRYTGAGAARRAVRSRNGAAPTLPEPVDSAGLARRLKDARGPEAVPPGFQELDWPQEAHGGTRTAAAHCSARSVA